MKAPSRPTPLRPAAFGRLIVVAVAMAGALSAQTADPPATPPPAAEPPLSHDPERYFSPTTTHYYPSATRQTKTGWLFLPPEPPPLGGHVPLSNPYRRGEPAPSELADFVHESFYPSLATRLDAGELSHGVEESLHAYRARKRELQNALRGRLAALKDADPSTRDRALADFAAVQAPALAALEAEAEKLRTDLRRLDILGQPLDEGDWSFPSDKPLTPEARAERWRAAAFYQDGLSLEQRLLLREFAAAGPAALTATTADRRDLRQPVAFSPATASFRLVAPPAAALARKLDDFAAVKRGLARELVDQLAASDPREPEARTATFRRLAAAQAPRFAALEALAEAIRRDLAADPAAPGPPTPPALPADLSARIAVYRAHKQDAIRVLHEMLAADARTAAAIRFRGDAAPAPDPAEADPAPAAAHPPGVAAFERKQTELVEALNLEKAAIREALADYVRRAGTPQDHKSIDDLLRDFEDARQQQETWVRFRDYRAAVLLPGLSPAQRRLLFDGAVEELALPLPPGRPAPAP